MLDPTVLFCNIHGGAKVTAIRFHEAFLLLATAAGINTTDFICDSDELDDRFDIQFTGDNAADNCMRFHSSLRLRRGKYKVMQVANDENELLKFYVNTDKNAAMVKKEIWTKSLQKMVEAALPSKTIYASKVKGTIYIDRKVLVNIFVQDETHVRTGWSLPFCESLKLAHETLDHAFKSSLVDGGGARL